MFLGDLLIFFLGVAAHWLRHWVLLEVLTGSNLANGSIDLDYSLVVSNSTLFCDAYSHLPIGCVSDVFQSNCCF